MSTKHVTFDKTPLAKQGSSDSIGELSDHGDEPDFMQTQKSLPRQGSNDSLSNALDIEDGEEASCCLSACLPEYVVTSFTSLYNWIKSCINALIGSEDEGSLTPRSYTPRTSVIHQKVAASPQHQHLDETLGGLAERWFTPTDGSQPLPLPCSIVIMIRVVDASEEFFDCEFRFEYSAKATREHAQEHLKKILVSLVDDQINNYAMAIVVKTPKSKIPIISSHGYEIKGHDYLSEIQKYLASDPEYTGEVFRA